MRITSLKNTLLIPIIVLALAGCNLPAAEAGTPTPNITQVYQTVEARITQNAVNTPATATRAPTATQPSSSPSPTIGTPKPTNTFPAAAQPTQASKLCDQAAPGVPIDVTVPDDTRYNPGQTFTKTWRLVNTGTCTWGTDYTLALFSGEGMSAPQTVKMPQNVAPGGSVDISVDLVAPLVAGSYQGNWKLRNAAASWFGIGPNGNSPFWVRIVVAGTPVSTGTITATATKSTAYPGGGEPSVVVNGNNTLVPSDRINLDSNRNNPGAGEDLSYQRKENGKLQLVPLSNALFAVVGRGTPTWNDCSSAPLGSAPMKLDDLTQGMYICYRTDQGLYGYLRLLNLTEDTASLGIQVLTWAQN